MSRLEKNSTMKKIRGTLVPDLAVFLFLDDVQKLSCSLIGLILVLVYEPWCVDLVFQPKQ